MPACCKPASQVCMEHIVYNTCMLVSDGAHVSLAVTDYPDSGCNLKFLLDWSWTKVTEVKGATDDWCK